MERKQTYLMDNEALLSALRKQRMKNGKILFGLLALGMIALGFGVYFLAPVLGIDAETAKYIAIAFLATGAVDYLILHFWDAIFEHLK